MSENPYMAATTVEELRAMEKALYNECFPDGKMAEGCRDYYEDQMELFDEAFACLFPDEYDYHKRGKQSN